MVLWLPIVTFCDSYLSWFYSEPHVEGEQQEKAQVPIEEVVEVPDKPDVPTPEVPPVAEIPAETPTDAPTEKPPAPPGDEDSLLSYEEWKQKKIRETAEQEKTKQLEGGYTPASKWKRG